MDKVLTPPAGRLCPWRPRPRVLLLFVFAAVTCYYLVTRGPPSEFNIVPYLREQPMPLAGDGSIAADNTASAPDGTAEAQAEKSGVTNLATDDQPWEIDIEDLRNWRDEGDNEDPEDVVSGYETDGKNREPGDVSKTQPEKDLRKMWRYACRVTANLPSSNRIYKNTLETLEHKDNRTQESAERLMEDPKAQVSFTAEKPVRFNPYPKYNDDEWKRQGRAPHVPCNGPTGDVIEDLLVFKGRPSRWPDAKFGSYKALDLDANLCWERETVLGQYGYVKQNKKVDGKNEPIDWDNVNWGDLQQQCVEKNAKRYDLKRSQENLYIDVYPEIKKTSKSANKPVKGKASQDPNKADGKEKEDVLARDAQTPKIKGRSPASSHNHNSMSHYSKYKAEKRTALLLRSYTGKEYTENDKQVIRALVSELSLKSGGEYEVFLLVQVKDKELEIFADNEVYQQVLQDNIPPEFHGITVLWNDQVVWDIYTEMKDDNERSVHSAQWLSVQKFSHDHPQFDYIWNWEMDFRYIGQHYDLLDKLDKFSRKQPRKGLWERNERYYIPDYHGDYDTDFRKDIEERYGDDTIWGPPDLPFITPVGPKPPVDSPREDNYEWGVGEDADVITVGPMFNPINSSWIIGKHIWGFHDETHDKLDLPRRTTIVTQSRISKRLLDIMHIENMRGNHVASEMTPQTIALLHGFKAVFAPHPVFMDRDWHGGFLNKWFNPGPNGASGGRGSPAGWGRERRFQGTTWYYRAEPPNRLYNNWMGWIDTGIGGDAWERQNGRPCLPSIMLHHVKNSEPTNPDFRTGFELAFG